MHVSDFLSSIDDARTSVIQSLKIALLDETVKHRHLLWRKREYTKTEIAIDRINVHITYVLQAYGQPYGQDGRLFCYIRNCGDERKLLENSIIYTVSPFSVGYLKAN